MRKPVFYLDTDYPRKRLKFSTVHGDGRRGLGCSLMIVVWALVVIVSVGVAILTGQLQGWGEWAGLLIVAGASGWLSIRALRDILTMSAARKRYDALLTGASLYGEVVKTKVKGNTLEVTYRFNPPNARAITGKQKKTYRRRIPTPPDAGMHVPAMYADATHHSML